MKRLRAFAWIFFLTVSSCSYRASRESDLAQEMRKPQDPFFVSVPICKFSASDCPSIEVEIEEKTFSMELDLGFRGDLAIERESLEQISHKVFSHIKPMYGIGGHESISHFYQIPKVKIGAITIRELLVQEEDS